MGFIAGRGLFEKIPLPAPISQKLLITEIIFKAAAKQELLRLCFVISQSRVHRLAFQRQYAEHALVHPVQRLMPRKAFQRLHTKGKLP